MNGLVRNLKGTCFEKGVICGITADLQLKTKPVAMNDGLQPSMSRSLAFLIVHKLVLKVGQAVANLGATMQDVNNAD